MIAPRSEFQIHQHLIEKSDKSDHKHNKMAVLCGMASIQHLLEARAVTSFTVCRRSGMSPFYTPMSSGHAHLDCQRYDIAFRVTREQLSDVAENLGRFLYGAYRPGE